MATKIQHRRGNAATWTSVDPILSAGEIGYESDTGKMKVGDGVSAWTVRPYVVDTTAFAAAVHSHAYADLTGTPAIPTTLSGSLNFELHGALASGDDTFARIPFAVTWTGWDIYSKQTGSIVLDVQRDSHANFPPVAGDSIAGSAKPTITASDRNTTDTLTGWTTSSSAGDIIRVSVDSVTTIEDVYLSLRYTRSI